MDIQVDLHTEVFNPVYLPYLSSNNRYFVLMGGAGSGKSVFITQKLLLRALTEKGHRILVVRKVASTLRNSVFALFKDVISQWGLTSYFTIQESNLRIVAPNGSEFLFVGMDNSEKIKSISGITTIWIEEATELKKQEYTQLNLRLRGITAHQKQIILTFNPISETHWLKKEFYDKEVPDSIKLKTTYLDNNFIDEEYRQVLEGLKDSDPVYYSIYCLGDWGTTGHMVWNNYKVMPFDIDEEMFDHIYGGLDFGFNDPSAFVKVGMKDGEVFILSEYYKKGLTNTELIDDLDLPTELRVTGDSAEPDRIKEFRQRSYNVSPAKKGKNSVKKGIDWIRGRKIYIHPSCVNFLMEIQGYTYVVDKDGNPTEEPIGFNDHLMSALRYALEPQIRQNQIQFLT